MPKVKGDPVQVRLVPRRISKSERRKTAFKRSGIIVQTKIVRTAKQKETNGRGLVRNRQEKKILAQGENNAVYQGGDPVAEEGAFLEGEDRYLTNVIYCMKGLVTIFSLLHYIT